MSSGGGRGLEHVLGLVGGGPYGVPTRVWDGWSAKGVKERDGWSAKGEKEEAAGVPWGREGRLECRV